MKSALFIGGIGLTLVSAALGTWTAIMDGLSDPPGMTGALPSTFKLCVIGFVIGMAAIGASFIIS